MLASSRSARRVAARPRLAAALGAGAVAISVNTALLVGADAVGFATARGGLLRLLKSATGPIAAALHASAVWADVVAPATSGPVFRSGFHVFVGLLMALFYAYAVEPALGGVPWVKGFVCAGAVWLLNAFLVLPLIGEGIAGSRHLGIAGMLGFAVIHTVFFVLLSVIYGRLSPDAASS